MLLWRRSWRSRVDPRDYYVTMGQGIDAPIVTINIFMVQLFTLQDLEGSGRPSSLVHCAHRYYIFIMYEIFFGYATHFSGWAAYPTYVGLSPQGVSENNVQLKLNNSIPVELFHLLIIWESIKTVSISKG